MFGNLLKDQPTQEPIQEVRVLSRPRRDAESVARLTVEVDPDLKAEIFYLATRQKLSVRAWMEQTLRAAVEGQR